MLGHEHIAHLKVAASRRAKSRHFPVVVDCNVISRDVAAERRLIAAIHTLHAGKAHEVRCMVCATSEGPSARQAITPVYLLGSANGARGARHEGSWV